MLLKIIKSVLIVLLCLFLIAFATPYFFKDKIVAKVKTELNKKLNAKVDFSDVSISFFRHFPKLAIGINDITIVGINQFNEDTLFSAKQFDIAVDIMSAVKGETIKIYKVSVNQPRIKAIVNVQGENNWSIMKPDTSIAVTDSSKAFQLNLDEYTIKNGYIFYNDQQGNLNAEIININHTGNGDFTAAQYLLQTKTTADEVNVNYKGISYFNKIKTDIIASFDVDAKANKYTFKTDDILLNDLKLNANGFVELLPNREYNMGIKFNTLTADFKSILSFIPTIYKNNFSSIKTSGNASVEGVIKGIYKDNTIPSYNINMNIKDGFFQYPDLPVPVKNIFVKATVSNTNGVLDNTVINISKASFQIENDPFDFSLFVKNPMTNLFVDAYAKGKLDLGKVNKFMKLQKGTLVEGVLNANAMMKGNASELEKKNFANFYAEGNVDLSNFLYQSTAYPSGVSLKELNMKLSPQNITLSNVVGKFMNTNFSANGYINNMLAFYFSNKPLEGVLNAKVDKVKVMDWMGAAADTNAKTNNNKAFTVPSNLNFVVNATAENIVYDKLNIANASGSLKLLDETINITNLKGEALDGTIVASGSYSTKTNKSKPIINMNYEVKNADIQKTFLALNTLEKIMPIGKFLSGKLNSQFNMNGFLGENMMPDLSSISGIGNLFMIEGVLNKFQPLEALASNLKIKELTNIAAKDIKAFIEFSNGKVLVKPFAIKVKGIEMEIGGLHGFAQDMDYTINMKVPRIMMGDKGNSFINEITAKATQKGVPISVGEVIPIQVKMGGTIKNPTIKTDLKQTATTLTQDLKKQVEGFVQTKIDVVKAQADSAKKAVKDTVAAAKKELLQAAQNEILKQLGGNKDSTNNIQNTKENLEQKGKNLLNKFNPFKKKVVIKDTAQ